MDENTPEASSVEAEPTKPEDKRWSIPISKYIFAIGLDLVYGWYLILKKLGIEP